MSDERFDFRNSAPLRKSYIIASSARSGSTYLALSLAQTGLLGAPSEVFNSGAKELQTMMARFKAFSHADYIAKLLAHRTSRNGVFGLKAHFHQFETFLKDYPALLEALAPVTFIHIERRDKVAQAVSMVKALQSDQWSSRWDESPRAVLRYDGELIAKSMKELELQNARWLRWFDLHKIAPHRITYEDLIADTPATVRSIVERFGVQNDEPDDLNLPPIEKQSDDTNREWIECFVRETRSDGDPRVGVAGETDVRVADPGSPTSTVKGDFFDRYDRLLERLPESSRSSTGFISAIRMRRRHHAIIAQNRALFRGARVLDIISAHGFWSLAALDAGAAHVLAVETSQITARTTRSNLSDFWPDPQAHRVIFSRILAALQSFAPEQFDVILCKGFVERCPPVELFEHLSRLRPRHVILDTRIAQADGPAAHFALAGVSATLRKGKIAAIPSHELIAFLAAADFRWRLVDWQAMGLLDWTGLPDYARDARRTYVLDRLS